MKALQGFAKSAFSSLGCIGKTTLDFAKATIQKVATNLSVDIPTEASFSGPSATNQKFSMTPGGG